MSLYLDLHDLNFCKYFPCAILSQIYTETELSPTFFFHKRIYEVAGSIFAHVSSTVHLIACFLDQSIKLYPKALHIFATQVFIQLKNTKDGIYSLENVIATFSDLIDLLKILATTLAISYDNCLPV